MMHDFRRWWSARSRREQRLLLVMAALLLVAILWLLVLRPLDDRLSDARARHARAVLDLGAAQDQVDAIKALERNAPSPSGLSIEALVTQQATEAGFTLGQVQTTTPGHVSLTIPAARSQSFFAWVETMQRREGILVDRLIARANTDATLDVQVELRARGR